MFESLFVFIRMIFAMPIMLLLLLLSLLIPPTIDTDIANYETYRQEMEYATEFMPEIEELGQFDELRFGYKETPEMIFLTKTLALTVQYSADEYVLKKETLNSNYSFIEEPIIDGERFLLDDSFSYQGYDFRAIPAASYEYQACKYFGLLGINDEQRSIAWLYFWDPDRDYLAESGEDLDSEMGKTIESYFHWEPFTE